MRDWQAAVDGLSPTQRLVHLALRYTDEDEERLRAELVRVRKRAYEQELTFQAERAGVMGRRGRLTSGSTLSQLNEMSRADARSIVASHNYDLAGAISNVGSELPQANRYTYANRLQAWEQKRGQWKLPEVAQYTENSARAKAQQDFYRLNGLAGSATLNPTKAVCPVCQGWVNRRRVPLEVAENNPPPYHVRCPHYWNTRPEQVPPEQAGAIWLGE